MKKKLIPLVLLTLILFAAIIPLSFPKPKTESKSEISVDVTIFREEFANELDAEATLENALSEEVPFWVDMVDAEGAEDGEGVYVAVLDTGLLSLWPLFFSEANIAWEYGMGFTHDIWWDDGLVIGPLRDDRGYLTDDFMGSGHGTHVVSTIVGYRFASGTADFWVRGVAPEATIIPVLVLDAWEVTTSEGTLQLTGGTDEMVAAGINYVADLKDELDAPLIISMSLGGPEPSPMIEEAIDYAISEGVIVVASAGNEGYAGMGWPGAYPQVISCGMAGWTEQFLQIPGTRWWVDNDVPEKLNTHDYWGNNWQIYLDEISSRPNKDLGQKPFHLDVTTPGAAIVGPYKPYFSYDLGYYYLWGTSMAAPHVSGIAALILESYNILEQKGLERTLKSGAAGLPLPCDGSWVWDPWYDVYHFEWYGKDWGSGFLQADEALKTVNTRK